MDRLWGVRGIFKVKNHFPALFRVCFPFPLRFPLCPLLDRTMPRLCGECLLFLTIRKQDLRDLGQKPHAETRRSLK